MNSDEVQNGRLKIALCGKEFAIQGQVNKVVQRITCARGFIGQAVSSEPHATLAWAEVSLLLPVSL
jgi:N-terminal domain of NWD NACHT-NTPase